jgi:hypothetical protein
MARWIWPTRSTRITGQPEAGHVAFDIGPTVVGRAGDPVIAPIAGQITHIGQSEFGYDVRLFVPEEGVEVVLAHLAGSASGLQVGQQVRQGQLLGLMGASGMDYLRRQGITPEVHLHYEIREPGPDVFNGQRSTTTAIDPRRFYPLGATSSQISLPASLAAFQFASPGAARAAGPASPQAATNKPPREAPSKAGATTPSAPSGSKVSTATSKATRQTSTKSGVPVGESEGSAEGITILHTPFGDVTVPSPGIMFVRVVGSVIGVLVVLVSLAAVFRNAKSGTGKKIGGMVEEVGGAIPVVGGIVSKAGTAQVQYSSGKKTKALGTVARAAQQAARRGA